MIGRVAAVRFPCTLTVIEQIPSTPPDRAGMIPPAMEIVLAPGLAVMTPVPHVVLAFGTGATTTPSVPFPGRLSVTPALIKLELLELSRLIVMVERPLALTVVGWKFFVTVSTLTVLTFKV